MRRTWGRDTMCKAGLYVLRCLSSLSASNWEGWENMAATIWSTGWRAGTASLDPSILDTKNRGGGRLAFKHMWLMFVCVQYWGCISCFTTNHLLLLFLFPYLQSWPHAATWSMFLPCSAPKQEKFYFFIPRLQPREMSPQITTSLYTRPS